MLLAPALFVSAHAAPASIEERLQALEAGYAQLKEENARLRAQLAASASAPAPALASAPVSARSSNDSPVQVLAGGKETQLMLGGFIQGQYENGDAGDQRFLGVNDRFYIRRGRVSVTGSFAENFDFKVEADFGANSLGAATGIRASANEIYINWNAYDTANVRVGYLKPAFGAEQLWSDVTTYTIERSLGSDRIADGRQPGLGLYGNFLEQRLGYLVTVGHGNGSGSSLNDNDRYLGAARVYGTLFDADAAGRLTGGANVMRSDDSASFKPGFGFDLLAGTLNDGVFRGKRRGWGVDAEWTRGRFGLSGELLRERFEPENAIPAAAFDAEGWQLTAAYMVLPQRLQAVLRREVFDPDIDTAGDATENWLAGLNYFIKGDDLKLMINYLFGDMPGSPDDSGRVLARVQLVY